MAGEKALLADAVVALRALPGVEMHAESPRPPLDGGVDGRLYRPDLELSIRVQERPVVVVLEAKASGYPRDVREAMHQLRRMVESRAQSDNTIAVPMLVAASLSSGARELLRQGGMAYWDRSGSLYLKLPWAIYYVDRAPPPGEPRTLRHLYKGRSAQVLHAMLLDPDRRWHIQDLAAQADVSPYTAHRVLTALEEQLWVERNGSGPATTRLLREPGKLLDLWAGDHSLAAYTVHRYYHWTQSSSILRSLVTQALDTHGIAYALTLASGADLIAPFGTVDSQLQVLLPAAVDIDHFAEAADLSPAQEGENVLFLSGGSADPLQFRRQVNGVFVASPVWLYLDLWAWPKRGKEQARHLRSEVLPY